MSQPSVARPPLLPSLTGLRFLAAFQVASYHAIIVLYVVGLAGDPEHPRFAAWCAEGMEFFNQYWWLRGIVQGCCIVMAFFFTLSGFILSYTCLSPDGHSQFNTRNFFAARVGRVYPVYLLGLLLYLPTFIMFAKAAGFTPLRWFGVSASTLTLTQAWNPDMTAAWNPPAWSLSVEAFFYVLFPLLMPLFDGWSTRRLYAALFGFWMLSLIPPVAYVLLDPDGIGPTNWLSDAPWFNAVKHNPLVRLPEILGGMTLARIYASRRIAEARGDVPKLNGAWLSIPCAAVLFGILTLSEHISYPLLHGGLLLPLVAGLIYGLAVGGGPIDWVLSRRWAVYLGESCYTLYILHSAIVALMTGLLIYVLDEEKRPDPPSPLTYVLECAIVSIVLAALVFKFFEEPMRRRIRRWLGTKPTPRAAVAVATGAVHVEEAAAAPAVKLSSPAP